MVPPRSDRVSRAPPYSRTRNNLTRTGLSPALAALPSAFRFVVAGHWPGPRSLATTNGVSVDVLSSGYLDISVHRVCFPCGMTLRSGFPIRKSTDQSLFAAPRGLSQRITSFIASYRQGIHQMPFKTLDRPYTKAETGTTRFYLLINQRFAYIRKLGWGLTLKLIN